MPLTASLNCSTAGPRIPQRKPNQTRLFASYPMLMTKFDVSIFPAYPVTLLLTL